MTSKPNQAEVLVALHEVLQKKEVGTQEEIRQALELQGFSLNQVKISRLLNKIGAIKMNEGKRTVYRLPTELVNVRPDDSLKHLILNIGHNGHLIVIQATPGGAQLVARLVDLHKELGILGTVAGDDTIFIAPQNIERIEEIYQQVYRFLLGE